MSFEGCIYPEHFLVICLSNNQEYLNLLLIHTQS